MGLASVRRGWWLMVALLLGLLQFMGRGGQGTLQACALRGNAIQQGDSLLDRQSALVDSSFALGHPAQQSMGRDDLFQMHPFDGILGLPLGFEGGPELLVFLRIFPGSMSSRARRPASRELRRTAALPRK